MKTLKEVVAFLFTKTNNSRFAKAPNFLKQEFGK